MENKNRISKIVRNYILICLCLIALSCLGFIWHEWVIPCSVAICSLFGTLVIVLLAKSDLSTDASKKKFMLSLILRYFLMAVGLIACGFLVKYTGDPENKKRFFFLVIAAVPYFATSFALYMTKE